MKISDLANATHVKVETIRYYEQIGLLPPPARSASNYRSYEDGHLQRLNFIRRSRDLGFSIDQIRELLSLSDNRALSCCAVDQIATQHRADVEQKINDLKALARELDSLIDQCGQNVIADCRIIEALSVPR